MLNELHVMGKNIGEIARNIAAVFIVKWARIKCNKCKLHHHAIKESDSAIGVLSGLESKLTVERAFSARL